MNGLRYAFPLIAGLLFGLPTAVSAQALPAPVAPAQTQSQTGAPNADATVTTEKAVPPATAGATAPEAAPAQSRPAVPNSASGPAKGQPPAASAGEASPSPPGVSETIMTFAIAHPVFTGVIAWGLGFPLLWSLLLLLKPESLLTPLRLCASIGELSLLGFKIVNGERAILLWGFVYRERVLDRWLELQLPRARRWFADRDTVRDRAVWIDVPVRMDGRVLPAVSPDDLRPLFEKSQLHLLIHGDGGTGKTSLACEIARWAMAAEASRRLRGHAMLPVLLESDFVRGANDTLDDVLVLVRLQIQAMVGAADVPLSFVRELCASGRVLIIVDSLSERSESVRAFLEQRAAAAVPFRSVVFTSRTEERKILAQVAPTRIQPVRLLDDALWEFVEAYLSRSSHPRFSGRDVLRLCGRLSDMAGDRDITPMLATMYADMEVRARQRTVQSDQPRDIPGLMLEYVRQTSERAGPIESVRFDDVLAALGRICWELVRESYNPRTSPRPPLVDAVAAGYARSDDGQARRAAEEQARTILGELETRLHLLQAVGPGGAQVKVVLDPLAEYMAASHVVNCFAADEQQWRDFISRANELSQKGGGDAIRGFLLAVRECSTAVEVPAWLRSALVQHATFDVVAQAASRRSRQLRFLAKRLERGERREKLAAIASIESLGYIDREAEAVLANVAKNESADIRGRAVYALSELKCRSHAAREALAQALADDDGSVRWWALRSLDIVQTDADKGIGLILPLTRDPEPKVRQELAGQLGRMRDQRAQAELESLVSDPEHKVRVAAAFALTLVAPGARTLQTFVRVLRASDDLTELSLSEMNGLTEALGRDPAAVTTLAERLDEKDADVLRVALQLVVKSVRSNPPADLPERVRRSLAQSDPHATMWAAVALWNWDMADAQSRDALTRLMTTGDVAVRQEALGLLSRMDPDEQGRKLLRAGLSDEDDVVRLSSAMGLLRLNENVDAALAALSDLADSTTAQTRHNVVRELERLGDDTRPEIGDLLLRRLPDSHTQVREATAECILKRRETRLLQALAERVGDDSKNIRKAAATAFELLDAPDTAGMASLRSLLDDSDFTVRLAAAKSYWKHTGSSALVLPVLFEFRTADWWWDRRAAFDLLADIAAKEQVDIRLIALGLEDNSEFTRLSAMKALLARPGVADSISARVTALLDDDYEFVRAAAIEYAVRAGAFDASVRQRIAELAARDPEHRVKAEAAKAIGEFPSPTPDELHTIVAALHNPHENVFKAAAQAVGDLGIATDEVVTALIDHLRHEDALARHYAEVSLIALAAREATHVFDRCADAAATMDAQGRRSVLRILETADDVQSFASRLIPLLDDPELIVRKLALALLSRSSGVADDVLGRLEELLKDPDASVRTSALIAVERFAPGRAADPAAAEQPDNQPAFVRLAAAGVRSVRGDESARSAIREALRDEDVAVARAAINVVVQLPAALEVFRADVEALLAGTDRDIVTAAAVLLLDGPSGDAAVQAIGRLLLQAGVPDRILRRVGKRATMIMPALEAAVARGDAMAMALFAQTAPRGAAIAALQQALAQPSPALQAAAAEASAHLGELPEAVLARLEECSHSRERRVRIASRLALSQARGAFPQAAVA